MYMCIPNHFYVVYVCMYMYFMLFQLSALFNQCEPVKHATLIYMCMYMYRFVFLYIQLHAVKIES